MKEVIDIDRILLSLGIGEKPAPDEHQIPQWAELLGIPERTARNRIQNAVKSGAWAQRTIGRKHYYKPVALDA